MYDFRFFVSAPAATCRTYPLRISANSSEHKQEAGDERTYTPGLRREVQRQTEPAIIVPGAELGFAPAADSQFRIRNSVADSADRKAEFIRDVLDRITVRQQFDHAIFGIFYFRP